MDDKLIGILAALGSAASWAGGAILFKKLGQNMSSLTMTLVKGAISLVLLAVVLYLVGYGAIGMEPLLLLAVSGILGIAVGDTCFFESLKELGPHTLVLLMMIGQVITVLFAVAFLGERPSFSAWLGIFLVVAGVGVVLFADLSGEQQAARMRGVIFGLLSVLCMSISIIIAKKGLTNVSAIHGTFVRMLAGTAAMFLFGLGTRQLGNWIMPFKDTGLLARFIVAVCVVTFGGFWLSLVAIKYVDVSIANTLNSTEPLFILPLAAIFLKEKITMIKMTGSVVAILGIFCLCIG